MFLWRHLYHWWYWLCIYHCGLLELLQFTAFLKWLPCSSLFLIYLWILRSEIIILCKTTTLHSPLSFYLQIQFHMDVGSRFISENPLNWISLFCKQHTNFADAMNHLRGSPHLLFNSHATTLCANNNNAALPKHEACPYKDVRNDGALI